MSLETFLWGVTFPIFYFGMFCSQFMFVSNPILLQFHTWDGQVWMSCRSFITSCRFTGRFSYVGWYSCGGEEHLDDFRFCISRDYCMVSCSFGFHHIAGILWNTVQDSLVSLCTAQLFLNLETFTNPVRNFLVWVL